MHSALSINPKIETNIDLFRQIHDFNLFPSQYIHSSWLDETGVVTRELEKVLPTSRRAHNWLSRWIIVRLCPGFFYDFSSAGLRLALLGCPVLHRLMTLAGLSIISGRLMRTVDGERIRQLTDSLGPDAYDFALKRAPLLIGGLYLPELRSKDTGVFSEQAVHSGRLVLQTYFGGQAQPLTDRLRLKFIKSIRWDFSSPAKEEIRQACWRLMHKILITEIGPPWTTLFTPKPASRD